MDFFSGLRVTGSYDIVDYRHMQDSHDDRVVPTGNQIDAFLSFVKQNCSVSPEAWHDSGHLQNNVRIVKVLFSQL